MKTRIDKSDVFKRAWTIYKDTNRSRMMNLGGYFYDFDNFSDCLRRAWTVEKSIVENNIQEIEKASKATESVWSLRNDYSFTPSVKSMERFYSRSGYHGD